MKLNTNDNCNCDKCNCTNCENCDCNMEEQGWWCWLNENQLTGEIPPEVCDLIESNNLNIVYIWHGNNLINTCD